MIVYCINLKERADRWGQMISQEIPFDLNRFDAIRGGSEGCAKSHLAVMELTKDYEYVLILEDDCHFLQDWTIYYKAIDQLPYNWDALYLGSILHAPLERYSENLFRLKQGWSTHGILYRRGLMDKILSDGYNTIKKDKNLDTYMARRIQPHYNCFIIYPLFATQYAGHSDVINGMRECNDLIPNYDNYTR